MQPGCGKSLQSVLKAIGKHQWPLSESIIFRCTFTNGKLEEIQFVAWDASEQSAAVGPSEVLTLRVEKHGGVYRPSEGLTL